MRTLPLLLSLLCGAGLAQTPDVVLDGTVPDGDDDFFDLPFEVPAGTAEIELHQASVDPDDILDFSLEDPDGFRGEGGGRLQEVIVNAAAATRSYLPGPLTPGTWRVSVGKAKLVSDAPAYHVEIFFRGEVTLAPAADREPYQAARALSEEQRFYAGDFHVHSEDSNDARPPLDEIAAFAHGRGLDFVVVSDHNTTAHVDRLVQAQQRAAETEPGFLLVPGVEFTTYAGHATGFGATEGVEWRIGHNGATLDGALDAFRQQGALVSINHPALDLGDLCIGCAWQHPAPAVGTLHGVEIETGGYRQTGFLFFDDARLFWEALLDQGHHLAAIGGSDDHQAGLDEGSAIGSPTTLVFADGLSVAALKQGILDSRTVVKLQGPEDPMIVLDTEPVRGSGGAPGDTVAHPGVVTVSAQVSGADGMRLWFVVDGKYHSVHDVTDDPQTFTLRVTPPDDGEVRVRAEVDEGDTPRTVTSYVWIRRAPAADALGCSCVGTGASPATALLALGLLMVLARSSATRPGARRRWRHARCPPG